MSAVPFSGVSTEAKGKLRVWKAAAARRVEALDRVFCNPKTLDLVGEYAMRGSRAGQKRAFAALRRRLGSWPVLELARFGREPLALWAMLRPREALMACPDNPSDQQNCVVVDYILAGRGMKRRGRDYAIGGGFWTLEVPDHALGRLLQRCPGASIDQVLIDAHHATLRIRFDDVKDVIEGGQDRSFLLPAGEGVFIITLGKGVDINTGDAMASVKCHTWLHSDQLTDRQVPLDVSGNDGDRLGSFILMPSPIQKRIIIDIGLEEAA